LSLEETAACIAEKEQGMSNEEKQKKPKRNWGQNQAGYLAALESKQVTVVFADGKALKGELTGVDTYELFIKQSNGLEVMISKGAVKYLHPAAVE
jgi:sRNA-binding regulator protein Hfq